MDLHLKNQHIQQYHNKEIGDHKDNQVIGDHKDNKDGDHKDLKDGDHKDNKDGDHKVKEAGDLHNLKEFQQKKQLNQKLQKN